ncbi:MAG: tetratricopeptide repeat protein [Alphaproteobacteria bacterium]|nr:tetratricopeptide repeat protein [Alphaproteobacteria bacterium]
MRSSTEAIRILRRAGEQGDDAIDLSETALALAALDNPQTCLTPYRDHLARLAELIKAEGPVSRLDDRLRLLRRVLVVQNRYHGDDEPGGGVCQSSLPYVIDKRCGPPVALGIIYLHVAEKAGWPMTGLNFPGVFPVRLSAADGWAILDPFRAGQTCKLEDLCERLKPDKRETQDGQESYGAPVSKRGALLRLQNGVKRHYLAQDNLDAAVGALQGMVLVAPQRQEIWRELGYLEAERGHMLSAITAFEVVSDLGGDASQAQQTETMLEQFRRQLN